MTVMQAAMDAALSRKNTDAEEARKHLDALVQRALDAHPRDFEGSIKELERLVYVTQDFELLWVWLARHRRIEARLLIWRAARSRLKRNATGPRKRADQALLARGDSGGQGMGVHHITDAPTVFVSPHMRRLQGAAHAIGKVAAQSLLDTTMVDGRPVGDLTAGEARTWARKAGYTARFVEMLAQNVPDELVIRKCRTADDAQAIWALAVKGCENV